MNKESIRKKISLTALGAISLSVANPNLSFAITEVSVTNDINLRVDASTNSPIITMIKKGDTLKIIENGDTWSKVEYKEYVGYCINKYFNLVKMDSPTSTVKMYCNTDLLDIRRESSLNHFVLGYLRYNDKVEVVERLHNGWSKIKYRNGYGYVNSLYLSKNPGPRSYIKDSNMECSKEFSNIWLEPSFSSDVVGKVDKNENVKVSYHLSRGWTRVQYNNTYGYIPTDYLNYI